LLRRDRDALGVVSDRDRPAGGVGGGPDRGHRVPRIVKAHVADMLLHVDGMEVQAGSCERSHAALQQVIVRASYQTNRAGARPSLAAIREHQRVYRWPTRYLRHVSVFRTCDDDDRSGWIRSYWDEEELTFVGEVGDGWITRHVEVGGGRPSLAGWLVVA
jgi:hypothetical protein